jgi:chaperonin GroEL
LEKILTKYQSHLYAPDSLQGIAQGIHQITDLLALTLGPTQGVIYNAIGPGKPERLIDAGLISRRVTELPSRPQDVGAMIVRSMAQQLQDKYQDGVATASVLTRALVNETVRQIAAGANPMLLRQGMAIGLSAARQALKQNSIPAKGQKMLENLVLTATGDAEISTVLAEIYDILGKYGTFMVEEYATTHLDREYIDGGRWRCRPASRLLLPVGGGALVLDNPLIVIIDEKIESFARIRPVLEIIQRTARKTPFLLVCKEIRGEALDALSMNYQQGVLSFGVAVSTASANQVSDDLDDMALLTGAETLRDVTGRPPERVRPEFFGRARQISLTTDALTIVGGAGDAAAKQQRVQALQSRLAKYEKSDEMRDQLRLRAARLAGSMAILKVGADTFQEREVRKDTAQKAARILEQALEGGIVAGGGVAYVDCIPAVLSCAEHYADDVQQGIKLVASALKVPFLQIVQNYGKLHPPIVLEQAQQQGADHGFDVLNERIVPMLDAGIIDSQVILAEALAAAVSAAASAITTDVIILRSRS